MTEVQDFLWQHKGALALCGAVFVVATLFVRSAIKGLYRIGRRALTLHRAALGESGSASAEFVIVIVPFLTMMFALMQLSLAAMARLMVSYSAFCAARAAMIVVPMEPEDTATGWSKIGAAFTKELRNNVGYGSNSRTDLSISKKAALIRNAAAYAMIPASPSIDVIYQDAMLNWDVYWQKRVTEGLDPQAYLDGLLGDLKGIAGAVIDNLGQQVYEAVKDIGNSPAAKQAAKDKINDWISKQSDDPAVQKRLMDVAGTYIDKYVGQAGSPTGALGDVLRNEIQGQMQGGLDKYTGQITGELDKLGGVPGSDAEFRGFTVSRALDEGMGSSGGAGGALLRAVRKLIYAKLATVVTLHDPQSGALKTKFQWGDQIKVKVTHLFYCQIPIANRIAGRPFYKLPQEVVMDLTTGGLRALSITGLPGYFMTLTAEHTMTNQGRSM